jgi:hypothetical protein
MKRSFFLDLAASGLRMPIGTDLILHEKPDAKEIVVDGGRLGAVVVEAARRYRTPLGVPLMDLTVEKSALQELIGKGGGQADHFDRHTLAEALEIIRGRSGTGLETIRWRANRDAIRHVAATSDLVPVGMSIGPFSLMTKLLADPITPVFLAGTGVTGAEDAEVRAVELGLEVAMELISRSIRGQVEAGARAVLVCEPAANQVYFSP